MSFKLITTHPVVDTPEYRCVLDEFRDDAGHQMMVVHLTVHKHSKSVFLRLLDEWEKLRACVTVPLFAWGEDDDDKYERFMRYLGFEHISFIPCTDGKKRRVFVSYPQGFDKTNAREINTDAEHAAAL